MARLKGRAHRLGATMLGGSIATAETLAARMPMLANPDPTFSDLVERQRMVSEKVEATAQGMVDASFAMGAFWLRFMTGGVRGPQDVLAGMADVALAATKPAHRTVRANARRLARRK